MHDLKSRLQGRLPDEAVEEAMRTLEAMRCGPNDPVALPWPDAVLEALNAEGAFLLLNTSYRDLDELEPAHRLLRNRMAESATVVALFEEEGRSLPAIENFLGYLHTHIDPLQRFVFGIKRVDRLSSHPVRILFGGMLPINRLRIRYGTGVATLIQRDADFHKAAFLRFRRLLSKALGAPILPLLPTTDPKMPPLRVELYEPYEEKIICAFSLKPDDTKEDIRTYQARLYRAYIELARQMKTDGTNRTI